MDGPAPSSQSASQQLVQLVLEDTESETFADDPPGYEFPPPYSLREHWRANSPPEYTEEIYFAVEFVMCQTKIRALLKDLKFVAEILHEDPNAQYFNLLQKAIFSSHLEIHGLQFLRNEPAGRITVEEDEILLRRQQLRDAIVQYLGMLDRGMILLSSTLEFKKRKY